MKKIYRHFPLLYFMFFLFISSAYAQQDTVFKEKKVKTTILPIAFYLPETNLGFGVVGIGTFRTKNSYKDSKPSSVQLVTTYTLNNQLLLYIPFDIQLNNNSSVFSGEIGFYDYLYNYYGIGTNVTEESKETYDVAFPRLILNYEKIVTDHHYVGGGFAIDHYYNENYLSDGLIETNQPLGYQGGTSLSINLKYRFDTRDNYFTTTKGQYLTTELLFNSEAIGSDYSYQKLKIDYRYFKTLKKKYTIATNFIQQSTVGNVPFFDMPYFGQSKYNRGADERKYRDNNLSLAQVEFRYPIYNRWAGVAFSGVGTVYEQLSDISDSSWKWTYGLGLRYMLNEKERINIRLDYGFEHQEESALYLTINEAF